jgi:hypothetical protein
VGDVLVPSRVAFVDRRMSLKALDWTVHCALTRVLPPKAARRKLVFMLGSGQIASKVSGSNRCWRRIEGA